VPHAGELTSSQSRLVPRTMHDLARTRRSARPQSHTLDVGLVVPTEPIAGAYVGKNPAAEVVFLGTSGTRQGDRDHRIRTRQSKAKHRVFGSDAGPCGSWLSRDLSRKGSTCGGVAPAFMPQKAGARGTTDRRDAVPWARRLRAGALPPVDVPTVEDEAPVPSAAPVRRRCGISGPPSVAAQPFGGGRISALSAGPPGVQPPDAG
jgi:hypothetical protein